jgi:hypothetical protein
MTISRNTEKMLKSVEIYASENSSPRKIAGLKPFLKSYFPTVDVRTKPSILTSPESIEMDRLASELASARVKDVSSPLQSFEPMYGEVDYELRSLRGKARVGGIVYDGRRLEDLLLHHMLRRQSLETVSIVLTDRLVSTFSTDDLRHHLRTIVCGFPSIVSVPGIVEAPARPREFYLMKQRLEMGGSGDLEMEKLKTLFRKRFIDYGDARTGHVLEGLVLQAVVFHLTLEPFCSNPDCRLFNAHWQEDLIRTQVESPRLCAKHEHLLQRAAKNPAIGW